MKQNYILAFDLGTGGNKSVLYHSDGTLIGSAFSPYDTYYPESGWAEQSRGCSRQRAHLYHLNWGHSLSTHRG